MNGCDSCLRIFSSAIVYLICLLTTSFFFLKHFKAYCFFFYGFRKSDAKSTVPKEPSPKTFIILKSVNFKPPLELMLLSAWLFGLGKGVFVWIVYNLTGSLFFISLLLGLACLTSTKFLFLSGDSSVRSEDLLINKLIKSSLLFDGFLLLLDDYIYILSIMITSSLRLNYLIESGYILT